ncbi:deoxyribonuclease IV [Actinoplanes subtropicus]|uniref:deoxyribonuclease IV n=1 Tax=Actinoplanes subtropicus TaxID=543632 RepID=UPI0004C339E3|nr:deoxyribonuclease IV [Actinoplanes subtropicus]
MLLDRRIGSHTKTSGGLAKAALPYVDAAGSETLQVYVSNSRGWAMPPGDPKQDTLFRDGIGERGLPAYIHASLLVNLGSPTELTVERSIATLAHSLERGRAIGASAVVYHAGSAVDPEHEAKALHQLREALLPLLDDAAARDLPKLLVEPSAGGGRSLASKVQDLGPYLAAAEHHPWLGVCFDTCHAWAAGHDLATPGGMTATLDALLATIGPDRLMLIHANDSKDECGSTRDRHETIGQGRIGTAAFAELMTHPATAGIPVIVETPSVEHEGHAADIALLKTLR